MCDVFGRQDEATFSFADLSGVREKEREVSLLYLSANR